MDRRSFLAGGVSVLAAPIAAEAQQPAGKVYRIGFLFETIRVADFQRSQPFDQALSELGYAEGHNLIVEYRFAEGRIERIPRSSRSLSASGSMSLSSQPAESLTE